MKKIDFASENLKMIPFIGHAGIVQMLVDCFDDPPALDDDHNPNDPDYFGRTPIYFAAMHGHTNVIEILAPLSNADRYGFHPNGYGNPNGSDKFGERPTQVAARFLDMPATLRKMEFILAMQHIP